MDESKVIGTIYSVSNSGISIVLADHIQTNTTEMGSSYRIGQIGSYVVMPESDRSVIGNVVSIEDRGLLAPSANGAAPKRTMQVQPLGVLQNGRFERGLTTLPALGACAYATDDEDVRSIFSTYRDFNFSLGALSLFDQERLYIDPNKFFSKHIALFGSSGSGKSSTVASILQKVSNLRNTHVIMLDLHGEYRDAFIETGNCIKINELELPYWLMNFEELVEAFVDQSEASATNQMMILKDAVLDSKRGKNLGIKEFLTVDTPVYFDFLDVSVRMKTLDTERTLGGKEGPFYGQFTRFIVRLESKLNDKRYEFMFKPKNYRASDTLPNLLTRIFGMDTGKTMTIIDLSAVPYDVLNILVSLLGRIIYDFNVWNKARQEFPILIVFEEAHNYLSASTKSVAARKTVERIAKEGRKYGVSCMIVSQRPAEISETIVSQCNNFVAMRLLNPNDQAYVKKLVPDSQANFIDVLPTLRQGEAYILGDAVAIPVRALIDRPMPSPGGADIRFYDKWTSGDEETNIAEVVNNWWKQIRS